MCVGIPAQVVEIRDAAEHRALVDVEGVRREVNIGLVVDDGVQEGSWVLVHVGFAMAVIDEDEAARTLELVREIDQAFEDELAQFGDTEPL